MTIIATTLVIAPIALPTALVSRPTEPSNWVPSGRRLALAAAGPSEAANSISRWNCAVTTMRSVSNCAAMVVPANQKTQPRKPKPSRMVRSSRHGRGIGRTRPSSRVPPSRKTAKIAPPTISSSGWARTMTPTMSKRQPEPDRGLLQLAPDERIAELRRARPLDMGLGRRRSLGHRRLPNSACSELPARPERNAFNQVSGLYQTVEPSSEKVMNSARPPIFSNGTGPPSPPWNSGTRLSAESSRLSPISQTWPAGMVVGGKSSSLVGPSSTVS